VRAVRGGAVLLARLPAHGLEGAQAGVHGGPAMSVGESKAVMSLEKARSFQVKVLMLGRGQGAPRTLRKAHCTFSFSGLLLPRWPVFSCLGQAADAWHPLWGARHLAVRSRHPPSWSGYSKVPQWGSAWPFGQLPGKGSRPPWSIALRPCFTVASKVPSKTTKSVRPQQRRKKLFRAYVAFRCGDGRPTHARPKPSRFTSSESRRVGGVCALAASFPA
jgi:hypothetical protein